MLPQREAGYLSETEKIDRERSRKRGDNTITNRSSLIEKERARGRKEREAITLSLSILVWCVLRIHTQIHIYPSQMA
jgi:hypothetical protein